MNPHPKIPTLVCVLVLEPMSFIFTKTFDL
jgi:hypothetical protein